MIIAAKNQTGERFTPAQWPLDTTRRDARVPFERTPSGLGPEHRLVEAALADEKSITLSCDAPGTIKVHGDRNLLFQSITNLLDNAIKYTPTGGSVSIHLRQDSERIVLSVADSGSGIPVDMREQVLQRFFRLDKSRSEPGAGLGLSLVQAITQRHGAQIVLDDNQPGLIVRLIFPTTRSPAA